MTPSGSLNNLPETRTYTFFMEWKTRYVTGLASNEITIHPYIDSIFLYRTIVSKVPKVCIPSDMKFALLLQNLSLKCRYVLQQDSNPKCNSSENKINKGKSQIFVMTQSASRAKLKKAACCRVITQTSGRMDRFAKQFL